MRILNRNYQNGIKTVITQAVWDEFTSGSSKNKLNNEQDAYQKVPLIFRAVRLRCDSLSNVPYNIYDNETLVESKEWVFQDSIPFQEWLWKAEASLLLRGAAFSVRLLNENNFEQGLQYLNPFTVQMKIGEDGKMFFEQNIDGKHYPIGRQFWTQDEMIYLREYSPVADLGFGTSATSVSLENSKMQNYLTRFSSVFFENGAMPITMIIPEGKIDEPERQRAENMFRRAMQGLQNAFRVFITKGGKTEIKTLTPDMESLAIPALDKHSIQNICWAFDTPESILTTNASNYAEKEIDYRLFLSKTIVPRALFFQTQINKVLSDYGQRIEFVPEEMAELQSDESERASSLKSLTDSGVPLEAALDILGYDLSEDAKRIIKEKLNQQPVPAIVSTPQEQIKSDLKKWETKSIKRLKESGYSQIDFTSDNISVKTYSEIYQGLSGLKTQQEIKNLFQRYL